MARHKDRPRAAGRSVHVLGTACGTLTVAAVVSAVYPVPTPVPAADRDPTAAFDWDWSPIDESDPAGGPLEIPDIGVVLDDYDERYAALDAARAKEAAEEDVDVPPLDDFFDEGLRGSSDWDDDSPDVPPENPVETLPGPPAAPPAAPPVGPSAAPAPAAPQVTDPTPPPAAPTTPPPTTTPPPPEEPPPTPPTEEPPPPAPKDTTLALGERYEHTNAEGAVDFTITLVSVDTALTCTAVGSVPAENGHLIGLQVEIVDPEPDPDGAPAISAADFRFVDSADVATADVDTDSSAACLEDGWPDGQPAPDAPVTGTLVLDVPAVTGTVVYRPAAWPAGLRWALPPAE